jgi:hypothetical protein
LEFFGIARERKTFYGYLKEIKKLSAATTWETIDGQVAREGHYRLSSWWKYTGIIFTYNSFFHPRRLMPLDGQTRSNSRAFRYPPKPAEFLSSSYFST